MVYCLEKLWRRRAQQIALLAWVTHECNAETFPGLWLLVPGLKGIGHCRWSDLFFPRSVEIARSYARSVSDQGCEKHPRAGFVLDGCPHRPSGVKMSIAPGVQKRLSQKTFWGPMSHFLSMSQTLCCLPFLCSRSIQNDLSREQLSSKSRCRVVLQDELIPLQRQICEKLGATFLLTDILTSFKAQLEDPFLTIWYLCFVSFSHST